MLQDKVCTVFENLPLSDAVYKLADLSGVSMALDPRAEDKAKTRITATFRNDVTLEGALRTIVDMAGLKVVGMQSSLYVTTPENAKDLQKELHDLK
jgi:hypothetical protein